MPGPETLLDLVGELRALPAKQRQAVLESLGPGERSRMMALLNRRSPETAPVPAAVAEPPSDGLSLWLAERVREARGGADGEGASSMTAATRHLLVKVAGTTTVRTAAVQAPVPFSPPARSLLEAVSDMLLPRRARA